jgi:hypothetical protein
MKKLKYIIIIVIFIIVSFEGRKIYRLNKIAKDLLIIEEISDFSSNQNKPVKGVVNIGKGLHKILINYQTPLDSISANIEFGDFFKENYGVTHSILYETKKSKLGLRMRYDIKRDEFHIVGYSGKIY